ncbi:hypothetical protein LBMAG56_09330 [Verrucomicrobiota bacterium]|nr:hypothetical protein LBMAG56_09330 [Verrucomicrobiota bacterium]
MLAVLCCWLAGGIRAQEPQRLRVLVDTDVGSYLDDTVALALLVASPEVELRCVTTCGGDAETRAWIACRFLTMANRREVPAAWSRAANAGEKVGPLFQYRYHPAVLFNRTAKPVATDAVELLYSRLVQRPHANTLLALGPLTNFAKLLETHPDCKPWLARIVVMGGAIRVGYNGRPPVAAEWNIKADVAAAKAVFAAGVPLVVVPLDATAQVKLSVPQRDRLFAAQTLLTQQIETMFQLLDDETPALFDAVAVAAAVLPDRFFEFDEQRLAVEASGVTAVIPGAANARVARALKSEEFVAWAVDRIAAHGERTQPRALQNHTTLVPQGNLPRQVHTFEDYETDIEKRWWLSGRLETNGVPPPGRRAFRSVLTLDFDDRQGDLKSMYPAVVFNPVPGPPMGENTRLSFRYRLHGTDTLRVQLYSLSKGYHRYLSVSGLPQDRWEHGTVDMTQMRRPDGTGGALAVDERIDDIQFYVSPTAQVSVDDVVLYDAAPAGEARPFPKRFVFTGWFDTGKQGVEWPGDFDIVPHQPPGKWKAAKSRLHPETGAPWLRISFRGLRPIGDTTALRLRYHLSNGSSLKLVLANSRSGATLTKQLNDLPSGRWEELNLTFSARDQADAATAPSALDELRIFVPAGAELLVDDVLVYEP